MKTSVIFKQVKTQFLNQCEWFAFREVREETTDLSIRNGKSDLSSSKIDQGLFVEVYLDGHFSSASTRDMTTSGVTNAFETALNAARLVKDSKIYKFPLSVRQVSKGQYHSPLGTCHGDGSDQLSRAAVIDGMLGLSQAMNVSSQIKTTRSFLRTVKTQQFYLSSQGADWQQSFDMVMTEFSATAENSKESQTRSDHGGLANCYQMSTDRLDFKSMLKDADRVGQEACELLEAPNCPEQTCDLILAPDQMLLQIHESIGHPLELDRILGDERNFAGWSFVKPTDFGNLRYGSSLMNITFDPTVANELASYAYDETGNPAQREYLIKDGILLRGLGSLESQVRLGLPGVANGRASSWNRPVIDRMANINLEPGQSTVDELISKVENGVLMHSNRSWSIDDYRDKFQFGCEYGKIIKDGKIQNTVKNPNYRGRTLKFWSQLNGLSRSSEIYGSPYCGKGEPSQIIRVGHSSPYALFSQIEVFGGG